MTAVTDFRLTALDGAPLDLARFAGRPMLIVNTASKCGFTPHYAGLQKLWEEFGPAGLVVLGVPSNDFGAQEPGSAAEIADFCAKSYGITFPLAAKVAVTGRAAHPLFRWLAREAGIAGAPRWNFYKYLIGRDGRLSDWFFCFTPPRRLRGAVQKILRS